MDPIEILDDSRSASGSGSGFDPSRTKRRRVHSPSVEVIDSGSSRAAYKGKGKAKVIDSPGLSSRSNVVVELPVLPLHVLKTYHLPREYRRYRPDHISRLHLTRVGPSEVEKRHVPPEERQMTERRNTFKERLKARGPSTLDPDGTFGDVLDSEGSVQWQASDTEDDEDIYSESGSDPIAWRRSRRTGYKAPERKRPKTRASRAIAKLAGVSNISFPILHALHFLLLSLFVSYSLIRSVLSDYLGSPGAFL